MQGIFNRKRWQDMGWAITALVTLSLLPGCGGGESDGGDDLVRLLARMPAESAGILVAPRPAETLDVAVQWVESKGETAAAQIMLGALLEGQGGEPQPGAKANLRGLFEIYGLDGGRPMGICFVSFEHDAVAYLPILSEEAFANSPMVKDFETLDWEVGGASVPAGTVKEMHWFIAEGYAVIAQEKAMLQAAAESFGAPHEEFPALVPLQKESEGDLVQYWDLDAVLMDEDMAESAGVRLLNDWYGSVVVSASLGVAAKDSEIRVTARKRTPTVDVAAPLELRHPSGPDTLLNVSLHGGSSLLELAEAVANDGMGASDPSADQFQAMLAPILKNAVALSVDMGAGGFPQVKLAIRPMQAEMLVAMLGMGGMRGTPRGEYDGVQLYSPEGVPPMYGDITYGFKDETLIAATTANGAKEILDVLGAPPEVSEDAPNRAELTLDLAKVASSPLMQMAAGMGGVSGPGGSGVEALADAPGIKIQAWDRPEASEFHVQFSNSAFGLVSAQTVAAAMGRARSAARSASSQNNQKQLSLVFKMYTYESLNEDYPPLNPSPGHLMFAGAGAEDYRSGAGKAVYPEYLVDAAVLVNPGGEGADEWLEKASSDPVSAIDDYHYIYLGFVVGSDEDMDDYTQAYLDLAAQGRVPHWELWLVMASRQGRRAPSAQVDVGICG